MNPKYINEFPYNIILDEELDERSISDTLIDTIYSDNRTRYFNKYFKQTSEFLYPSNHKLKHRIAEQNINKISFIIFGLAVIGCICYNNWGKADYENIIPQYLLLFIIPYLGILSIIKRLGIKTGLVFIFDENSFTIEDRSYERIQEFKYNEIIDVLIVQRPSDSKFSGTYLIIIDKDKVCYRFNVSNFSLGILANNIEARIKRIAQQIGRF
jgi:hypothetical protein